MSIEGGGGPVDGPKDEPRPLDEGGDDGEGRAGDWDLELIKERLGAVAEGLPVGRPPGAQEVPDAEERPPPSDDSGEGGAPG